MRLSKIYSNIEKEFSPIVFNVNSGPTPVNVIYAEVTKPKDENKDSHNLGKTTLIHLIDFLLLKDISGGKHFLYKHKELFIAHEFYIELLLNSGKFLTVKRSVKKPTRISFKQHTYKHMDFTLLEEESWDHFDVPLKKSVKLLDSYLNLESIKPWTYRQGVSYFLRTQNDYLDYFQISKFSHGQHIDWKPYLAGLLGFDYEVIKEKYALDKQLEEKENVRDSKQGEVQIDETDYNKLKTKISNRNKDIESISSKLDSFSFSDEESNVRTSLVLETEEKISEISDTLYNIDIDIKNLTDSISENSKFNLNEIKELYSQADIYFTGQLENGYNELVEFNKKITSERNKNIKAKISELVEIKSQMINDKRKYDLDRENSLSFIRSTDTFAKYKHLQKSLTEQMASQTFLNIQLSKLDEIRDINKELIELRDKITKLTNKIHKYSEDGSTVLESIAEEFNRLVKKVLGLEGILYVKQNGAGNLDFKIDVEETNIAGKITSQDEGTTYKKLLCVLFDLSILKVYSESPFFHFVYHDGVFEGLDNRKRIAMLNIIREYCSKYGIQYILSVIDADMPRTLENDEKIEFTEDEVILKLSDSGIDGRLFKTDKF